MEAQSKKPVLTPPNQGERFLLVGAELVTFKLRGEDYSIMENASQGGYGGPPPHRHLRQDEGFYVLQRFAVLLTQLRRRYMALL